MQSETDTPSKIDFLVCLSIQGPILPGDYRVGHADSLADLLGGLMSTINAATICIAAAKANGTT